MLSHVISECFAVREYDGDIELDMKNMMAPLVFEVKRGLDASAVK